MEFKIGDIVKISPDSRYYGKDKHSNPADVEGEVFEFNTAGDHTIRVRWKTEDTNYYRPHDLILVGSGNYAIY